MGWDNIKEEHRMTAGPYTGYDLSAITPLCMPWREVNHLLTPEFSRDAALLSFELASTAYDMQTAAWRHADWHDITYQIDNTLFTGPAVNGETEKGLSEALADAYQRTASAMLRRRNPITQLRGTLRQRDGSDTCKSLVMIHRLPGGRFVAAIGFMGTGKQIYDWISNFRMVQEDGVHKGFLQLTQEFEKNCPLIEFPQTARELGLEKLTLSDILAECRRPGSRFRLWMAGHSQGSAIMQLFALREISKGLLRQNVIGYGFASPSVLYRSPGCDPGSIPLFHILNADDPIPRVGAVLHVGRCKILQPDSAMRSACYGNIGKTPAFRDAMHLLSACYRNEATVLYGIALLRALMKLPDRESALALGSVLGKMLPDRLLAALGGRADQLVQFLIRHAEATYAQLTGGALPEDLLVPYEKRVSLLMERYGAQPLIRALLQAMALPHKLRGPIENNGIAAYQYIVTRRFDSLRTYVSAGTVPRSTARPLRGAKAQAAGRCLYHTIR